MRASNPLFQKHVPFKILPGLITTGSYDGQHNALTFVSTNGKVILETNSHLPSAVSSDTKDRYRFYPAPSTCCSIIAGRLSDPSDRDVLLLGSHTGVVVYDAYDHMDLFYKELPDGVNTILISDQLSTRDQPIVLIGGRCSLIALNENGTELFWTVMGDSITALAVIESDTRLNDEEEMRYQLVVGSEDCKIRMIHKDSIVGELSETEAVSHLINLGEGNFGYGLRNGTIGVYNRHNRLWRIKSKHQPKSFVAYDINQDGNPELICGWNNGMVDGRLRATGEVVFKTRLDSSIAGLVVMDYGGWPNVLLVCSVDGEIHGYTSSSSLNSQLDSTVSENLLRTLALRKQTLMSEIRDLNVTLQAERMTARQLRKEALSAIPADTQLCISLGVNSAEHCVNLKLTTTNGMKLHCVILFAEGLFHGESHVIHSSEKQGYPTEYNVQLRPPRDAEIDVTIRAYAAPSLDGASQPVFHVLYSTIQLPEFAMYRLISENAELDWPPGCAKPLSGVTFNVIERPQRLAMWMNDHFILPKALPVTETKFLSIGFECLRSEFSQGAGKLLVIIQMTSKGEVSIRTDHMEIAANMIQSIVRYLNVTELASTCDFPLALEQLKQLIELSAAHQVTRQQMMTDLAEKKQVIRDLIVLSETQRLAGRWEEAKQTYMELYHENRQLLTTYRSRTTECEMLSNVQKQINLIIEQASSLRAGRYKSQVIAMCRQALKSNNFGSLIRIIRAGEE